MKKNNLVVIALSVLVLNGFGVSPVSAYGGGGVWMGAGTVSAPSLFKLVDEPVEEQRQGQVLGAATFHFGENLRFGMRGDDVRELQERLKTDGHYDGPVTGFFGPLTRAAVIRYQEANDIRPALGFVGPLTRERLNSEESASGDQVAAAGAALSPNQRENIQAQIDQLLELVNGLMAKLKLLQ